MGLFNSTKLLKNKIVEGDSITIYLAKNQIPLTLAQADRLPFQKW